MQVAVRRGGSVLWSASDSGAFNLALGISPGDMLDFAVFGGYGFGNTGLVLTITSVAEPATGAAIAGVAMLGFGLWRRAIRGRRENPV